MTLQTFLPLPEAASKLGVSESELRSRAESGTIMAGKLPDGEIIVNIAGNGNGKSDDINARLRAIKRESFARLQGQAITVSEAAKKYGVHRNTILGWTKQKYITVLRESTGRGSYIELDEADVAYCAAIHEIRKQYRSRAKLLDADGKPYLLMHPNLAKARRLVSTGA